MIAVLHESSKREQSRREQRHLTAKRTHRKWVDAEKLRQGDGGGNSDALEAVSSTRKRVAPKQGRGSTPHSQPDPSVTHENARDGSALFNYQNEQAS